MKSDQALGLHSFYSLQPKKGGRLQPMEYSQAAARMLRAFLRDITPREARGLVITTKRSTAITIRVIILQIPNRAPQKAYNSQPGRREKGVETQWGRDGGSVVIMHFLPAVLEV